MFLRADAGNQIEWELLQKTTRFRRLPHLLLLPWMRCPSRPVPQNQRLLTLLADGSQIKFFAATARLSSNLSSKNS